MPGESPALLHVTPAQLRAAFRKASQNAPFPLVAETMIELLTEESEKAPDRRAITDEARAIAAARLAHADRRAGGRRR